MNVRRMEAEAVRDSVLAMAGKLDTTMGGPEIDETKGDEIYPPQHLLPALRRTCRWTC